MTFSAQPPDLHRPSLGRESFAVSGPLALLGSAFYPILVHRLADSLAASFSAPVTLGALRFTWVATTNSPEDFHLQVIAHAGHTGNRIGLAYRQPDPPPYLFTAEVGKRGAPWLRLLRLLVGSQITAVRKRTMHPYRANASHSYRVSQISCSVPHAGKLAADWLQRYY